jgi:hypothetical protein
MIVCDMPQAYDKHAYSACSPFVLVRSTTADGLPLGLRSNTRLGSRLGVFWDIAHVRCDALHPKIQSRTIFELNPSEFPLLGDTKKLAAMLPGKPVKSACVPFRDEKAQILTLLCKYSTIDTMLKYHFAIILHSIYINQ